MERKWGDEEGRWGGGGRDEEERRRRRKGVEGRGDEWKGRWGGDEEDGRSGEEEERRRRKRRGGEEHAHALVLTGQTHQTGNADWREWRC